MGSSVIYFIGETVKEEYLDPVGQYYSKDVPDFYRPIKIGRTTSKDLEKRLATLQTGNPAKLSILATFPGSSKVESTIHRFLKRIGAHKYGEWFDLSTDGLFYFLTDKERHWDWIFGE